MFKKILFFSMLLWSLIGLFVILFTGYFDNSKKTSELLSGISSKLKSYNSTEIHKDNALSEEADSLKQGEALLKDNKEVLVSNLYTLQSDVSSNQYKTLTALSVKFVERYLKGSYEDCKVLLSDMRSIVNSSGLTSEIKIRLLKELRDVELSLVEITSNIADMKEINYKLGAKREEINKKFFSDILNNTDKSKSEFGKTYELKQIVSTICILFLLLGVIGIAADMYLTHIRLKKDADMLFSAIDSVHAGAEPEVIERHKTIPSLRKLKTQIYEVIKLQSNELNFLKHSINSIHIPIMLKMEDRVFKNKAMGDICINLAVIPSNLGDEFMYDNMLYVKTEQPNGICLVPLDWERLRNFVDTETSYGIKTNNTPRLIKSLHDIYEKLKNSNVEKENLEKALAENKSRIKDVINALRDAKEGVIKKDKIINNVVSRGRILLEDGINMSGTIKVFGIKVSDLYAVLKNMTIYNSRIEDSKNIISEQAQLITTLLSLLYANKSWLDEIDKSFELRKISGLANNELQDNIGRLNKAIITLEQIYINYKKINTISDENFTGKLTNAINILVETYKNVFNMADKINTGLEDLSKTDAELGVNV